MDHAAPFTLSMDKSTVHLCVRESHGRPRSTSRGVHQSQQLLHRCCARSTIAEHIAVDLPPSKKFSKANAKGLPRYDRNADYDACNIGFVTTGASDAPVPRLRAIALIRYAEWMGMCSSTHVAPTTRTLRVPCLAMPLLDLLQCSWPTPCSRACPPASAFRRKSMNFAQNLRVDRPELVHLYEVLKQNYVTSCDTNRPLSFPCEQSKAAGLRRAQRLGPRS
ncbi:hypothetical protein BD414DRAFT_329367 [Trametes punicea]|nr:hypothetical protein BD414DRAFT_329367 [Trametes punicea]